MSNLVAGLHKKNGSRIFPEGNFIIEGRFHYSDLREFLTHHTGDALFVRKFPVWGGRLYLQMRFQGEMIKWKIRGLNDLKEIYVMVREERDENGKRMKVLYGWGQKSNFGVMERARIRYRLPNLEHGYRPEDKPVPLPRLKSGQEQLPELRILNGASNGRTIYPEWEVIRFNNMAYVDFSFRGKQYTIDELHGYRRVTPALRREGEQLVLRLYENPEAAKNRTGTIRKMILAERVHGQNGGLSGFTTLDQMRTIFSIVNLKLHPRKNIILAQGLRDYLQSDQKEGSYLDLQPRRVYDDGSVYIGIDTDKEEGGTMILYNYKNYPTVYGRVITRGNKKIVYFWPDAEAREKGEPPINPQGHMIAKKTGEEKDAEGKWKIIFRVFSEQTRQRTKFAQRLGNFIFANVGERVFADDCPLYIQRRANGALRKLLRFNCRGMQINIEVKASLVKERVFVSCRTVGGRLKLLELWRDEQAYKRNEKPLAARFVTFKADRKAWQPFYARLNEIKKFEDLIRTKKITRKELYLILKDEALYRHLDKQRCYLVDALFFRPGVAIC